MQPSTATQLESVLSTAADGLRPFTFNAPQAELDELRRRIVATRLPERETVTDFSQGVLLLDRAETRALLGYRV